MKTENKKFWRVIFWIGQNDLLDEYKATEKDLIVFLEKEGQGYSKVEYYEISANELFSDEIDEI